MNRAELMQRFPKASESFLAANADDTKQPDAPFRPKRRTLKQIVLEDMSDATLPELPPPYVSLAPSGVKDFWRTFVPVELKSESNVSSEHWTAKGKRVKAQRQAIALFLVPIQGREKPYRVTLTRLGAKLLDSNNLATAFKHAVDEIAKTLGFDDKDPNVIWDYRQFTVSEKASRGFVVVVEWMPPEVCPCCKQVLPLTSSLASAFASKLLNR